MGLCFPKEENVHDVDGRDQFSIPKGKEKGTNSSSEQVCEPVETYEYEENLGEEEDVPDGESEEQINKWVENYNSSHQPLVSSESQNESSKEAVTQREPASVEVDSIDLKVDGAVVGSEANTDTDACVDADTDADAGTGDGTEITDEKEQVIEKWVTEYRKESKGESEGDKAEESVIKEEGPASSGSQEDKAKDLEKTTELNPPPINKIDEENTTVPVASRARRTSVIIGADGNKIWTCMKCEHTIYLGKISS